MSDDMRANIAAFGAWLTDFTKSVGVPATVCGAVLWMNYNLQHFVQTTMSEEQKRSTAAMESLSTVVGAIDKTITRMAEQQAETRAVLRELGR